MQVDSQLQPDPNQETVALLRVLLYNMNNTTFDGDVPTVPQWSGPPRTLVQVQAILYASLATSLFSAFLAMLGKQWLNRYTSTDMRGSAIERSQNRQQKHNGIVSWYFEHVMESLPLMLQAALLLLGCALSRYLWGINTAVASVVIGVTSIGVAFYLFVIVAGAASKICPYQTPGSRILRSAITSAPAAIASAFRYAIEHSELVSMIKKKGQWLEPRLSRSNVKAFLRRIPRELPVALILDTFHLGQAIVQPLVAFFCQLYPWLFGISPAPVHGLDQQTTTLDLQCISWILQTSLDKADHLSTLESLATMVVLPDKFDPTLVMDCFSVYIGCVKVINTTMTIAQGLEQLAIASATCLLHTFSHLLLVDPTLDILQDIYQQYNRVFPTTANFNGLLSFHIFHVVHSIFSPGRVHSFSWGDYKPSSHEHAISACALAKFAWYQRSVCGKVPCWILRFTLHSLSLNPLPSTSVVVDCLFIIAIDLGCDVSSTEITMLDKRYVYTKYTLVILSNLELVHKSMRFQP